MHASPAACPAPLPDPSFLPAALLPPIVVSPRPAPLRIVRNEGETRRHAVRHCRDFYAARAATEPNGARAEHAAGKARLYHLLATEGADQW